MTARVKKLLGSLALLFGLFGYIIVALLIGARLPHIFFIELPYYLIAGLAWVFPARSVIAWMHR